jgi:lipopolysaccharide assembly outer membrane protein LptD (OstA)
MKRMVLILCVGVFALAQTPVRHGEMLVQAGHQERNGAVVHLSGDVKIEIDSMVLRADDVDYNADTSEMLPHGNVRIKLK